MGGYRWIPRYLLRHSCVQASLHSEVPGAIEIRALIYHRFVSILFDNLSVPTFPVSLEGG